MYDDDDGDDEMGSEATQQSNLKKRLNEAMGAETTKYLNDKRKDMKKELNELMNKDMEESMRRRIMKDEEEIKELAEWRLSGNYSIGGSSGSTQKDKHDLRIMVSTGVTGGWDTEMRREEQEETRYYSRYSVKRKREETKTDQKHGELELKRKVWAHITIKEKEKSGK